MRKAVSEGLVVILMLVLILTACTPNAVKKEPTAQQEPKTGETQTTTAITASKVFTTAGGDLTLEDGTKLIVPEHAFSENSNIVMSSAEFGANSQGIDISGLANLNGEITLIYPVGKNLDPDTLSVYGLSEDLSQTYKFPFDYNAEDGVVLVKIASTVSQSGWLPITVIRADDNTAQNKVKVVVQTTNKYNLSKDEVLMKMPYYEQVGQSCWVAATEMLIHGYVGGEVVGTAEPFAHTLAFIRVPDDDFGIDIGSFMLILPRYIQKETGKPVKWKSFISNEHLKWELLRQLDAGHPVILRYYARTSFHAVLVVGYKDGGETLIIHDPKNQPNDSENMDHAMYSDITWQWLNERLDQVSLKRQLAPIIWIDEPMTSPKTLQTIHAPGADEKLGSAEGEFAFYWTNKDTKHKARMAFLHFRPSTPSGYEWVMKDKPIDVVPSSVDSIGIDLPAWNGDFSPAKVTLITRVVAHGDFGAKEVYYKTQDVTLPAAQLDSSNTKHVKVDIPLSEVRSATLADAQGRESISIQVYLRDFNEASSLRDKFEVSATISAAPFVSSVSPQSILPDQDTTITIKGSAFGKQPTTNSKVMVGNTQAKIVSWSDDEIKIKLPDTASTGSVTVYTGDKYEYKSNDNIKFTVLSKPDPADLQTIYIWYMKKWDSGSKEWVSITYEPMLFYAHDGKVYGSYIGGLTTIQVDASGTWSKDNVDLNFFIVKRPFFDKDEVIEVTGHIKGKLEPVSATDSTLNFKGTCTASSHQYNKNPSNQYDVTTGPYECSVSLEVF